MPNRLPPMNVAVTLFDFKAALPTSPNAFGRKPSFPFVIEEKNRDWVQNPHFNDRITETIVSWPLWRLVTREKHSRA